MFSSFMVSVAASGYDGPNSGIATGSLNFVTLPSVQPTFSALDVDNNVLYVYQPTSPLTSSIVITMVDLTTGVVTNTDSWDDEIDISVTAMACVQGILYIRTGTSFVDYGYIAKYNPNTNTWGTVSGYSPPDVECWLVSKNNEALILIHKVEGSGGPSTWELKEFPISGGVITGSPTTHVITDINNINSDDVFDYVYLNDYLYATVYANGGGYFASGLYRFPYGAEGYEEITFTGTDTTPEDGFGVDAHYRNTTGLSTDGEFIYVRDAYTLRSYNVATTETVTMLGVNNEEATTDGDVATSRLPRQRASNDTGFPGDVVYNPNDNYVYLVYNPHIRRVTLG